MDNHFPSLISSHPPPSIPLPFLFARSHLASTPNSLSPASSHTTPTIPSPHTSLCWSTPPSHTPLTHITAPWPAPPPRGQRARSPPEAPSLPNLKSLTVQHLIFCSPHLRDLATASGQDGARKSSSCGSESMSETVIIMVRIWVWDACMG